MRSRNATVGDSDGTSSASVTSLRGRPALWATVFGAAGVLHVVRPQFFDSLVPQELPGGQRVWTLGSGVVELGLSAAILNPAARRKIGRPAALFLVGVLPGNVKMALDWQRSKKMSPVMKVGAWVRVVAQVPMIVSASRIR